MKKHIYVWIVAVSGLVLSFSFFSVYQAGQKAYVRTELDAAGDRKFYEIEESLYHEYTVITALKAFFESSTRVDPDEFFTFTRPFLEDSHALQWLSWSPVVGDDARELFESAQQEQWPGFRIREWDGQKRMVRRGSAEEYYPVSLLEPGEKRDAVMGFDLFSDPAIRSAVSATGRSSLGATGMVDSLAGEEQGACILIYAPVIRESAGKKEVLGYVAGNFRVSELMEGSLHEDLHHEENEAKLILTDRTGKESPEILYESPGKQEEEAAFFYNKEFSIAQRRLNLRILPTREFLAGHKTNTGGLVLGTGLLFTLLLTGYVRTMTNQSNEIRRQVRDRTEALSRHKDELENLINTIEAGIIMINEQREVQIFNPTAEKIFQYEPAEVAGKNVNMLMPDPYHANHDQYVNNYISTGVSKIIGTGREVEGRRKDGSVFPMHLAISEMELESARYFVGSVSDITQQKEVEESLRLAKEAAEETNRIKSDFMNTISHELRTPLTIILGNIDELADEEYLPEPDEIVEIAQDCTKAGEMLMQLINDLLDISKIDAGKMTLHKKRLSSSELIGEVAKTARVLAENKGLALEVIGDEAKILIDEVRMKQVLFNLLSNAVKFTDSGSVSITTRGEGEWFFISVADTGHGMDPESLTYIFDPFRQVDGSATRQVGGTGLGLAITKKLVELHRGEISVQSELGKGSEFLIKLPKGEAHENTDG